MTSNAEWTGVLLSTLLKEAGVKEGADWIVAEGVEEVKGASSIPMTKAMDDTLLAYSMNGEPVRPQQGFPLRMLAPGFEGIFNVKWLRRIKVVDQYYMTYNDYGHLTQDPATAALGYQIGPKSVIVHPSGGQTLPGAGYYQVSGLAWSGGGKVARVEVTTDGGETWFDAEIRGEPQAMAHTLFAFEWEWDGSPCELQSRCIDEIGQVSALRERKLQNSGISLLISHLVFEDKTTRFSHGELKAMEVFIMRLLKYLLPGVMLLGFVAQAQSPTYGVGRAPTVAEVEAWDIAIAPTGEELPDGSGTADLGAQLFLEKGCAGCHGTNGTNGIAPRLVKNDVGEVDNAWRYGRVLPIRSPYATTVWDYINRGMPLGAEGSLLADEVYSLTAYLLYLNDVITDDQLVLDQNSLPKIQMPNRDNWAQVPDWFPGQPRLEGYPY